VKAALLVLAAIAAAAPVQPDAAERSQTVALLTGGLNRSYRLHVPPGNPPRAGRPLVLLLHGHGSTAAGMERLTGFNELADREGILTAYPEGIDRSWADGRGGTPADRRRIDDVHFLGAVIDDVARRTHVDSTRVYVTGISNGGFMTTRVACEMSPKIAAAGPVAATMGESLAATCHPGRPVAMAFIDGDDDPLVPYEGGELTGGRGRVLSARGAAELWARLNTCQTAAPPKTIPPSDVAHDGTSVTLTEFVGCAEHSDVRLFRIGGGGHTWPGGQQYLPVAMVGRTSRNLNANDALWTFFNAHRRAPQSRP